MKKILYCDFDGTLIRENSEELLIKFLLETHYFKFYHYVLAAAGRCINAPFHFFKRGSPVKSWTACVKQEQKENIIDNFWERKINSVHINFSVLDKIKEFDGNTVIVTGSDQDLVYMFLKRKGLTDLIADVVGSKVGPSGIHISQHPYGKEKCKYLDSRAYKVGIANEAADIFYLSKCDEVYIVPGDQILENTAKIKKWKVI